MTGVPKKIEKAESSVGKKFKRPSGFPEKGQARIVTSSRFIQDSKVQDLQWPNFHCTVGNMLLDDAVYNAYDVTKLFTLRSLFHGEVESTGTEKSDFAAKFAKYCLNNMSYGTWWEALNNASSALAYGFSDLNIVLEKRGYGPYKNAYCIKKLAPRNQASIYGWVWNNSITEWKGLIQKPPLRFNRTVNEFTNQIPLNQVAQYRTQDFTYIPSEQLLHFTIDKTDDNPQGNSPLKAAYQAWMEKVLVSKYEIVGVSKDMAGALVIRVPDELLERASEDPTGEEAAYLDELQADAAALRAGESAYLLLSSGVDPESKQLDYDVQFKGIDGSGKSYSSDDIIDQKRKAIYNVFGAGFLILGQDGSGGSYSLSTDKTSLHGHYVERIVDQFADVINTQLLPRLLAANGIHLDYDDMPKYVPQDVTQTSLDEFSKAVQRMGSVQKLTEEMLEDMAKKARIKTGDLSELDYTDKGDSRSGESQGSSGTGDTQEGGANSATNVENKSYTVSQEDDDLIYAISSTGETIIIAKEE